MEIINELLKAVTVTSKSEARSKQLTIGPSEIGGCRRQTWLRLQQAPTVNPNTLSFPAMFGTAIHAYILEAFKNLDPFGERYMLEQEWATEVELKLPDKTITDTLVGHIDCYDKQTKQVIDWKSTKKTNLRYFPSQQQRWQVQLYGYLVQANGMEVDTVTLVAIPRDGDERDMLVHSEPYDGRLVAEALAWLAEVRGSVVQPPADKDEALCRHYCRFYDPTGVKGCASRPKAKGGTQLIEDNGIDVIAKEYLDINRRIAELEAHKDSIKEVLAGVNGTTNSGLTITWSQVAGRKSVDEEEVKKLLGQVPYKVGKPSERLTIK